MNEGKKINYCELVDKSPVWTKSLTSNDIVSNIEGILSQSLCMKNMYVIIQVTATLFWLMSSLLTSENDNIITRFRRVCSIEIDDQFIKCSCKIFERVEYSCIHIMCFLDKLLPKMIDLRYHRNFLSLLQI